MLVSVPSNSFEMKYRREVDLTASSSRRPRTVSIRSRSEGTSLIGSPILGSSDLFDDAFAADDLIDRVNRPAEIGDSRLERVRVDVLASHRAILDTHRRY